MFVGEKTNKKQFVGKISTDDVPIFQKSTQIFIIIIFIFILQQHFISYLQTKEKLQKLLKTRKKSNKITIYKSHWKLQFKLSLAL